ncbi:hypothetical protein KWH38_05680, partial [Xanthomonas campestris pv. convolvuli]|nr:hypothetical protein [Xanthomonas campestris pv. convolvuli]
ISLSSSLCLSLSAYADCPVEMGGSSHGQTGGITQGQANGTDKVARANDGLQVGRDEEAHIEPSRAAQKIRLRHGV